MLVEEENARNNALFNTQPAYKHARFGGGGGREAKLRVIIDIQGPRVRSATSFIGGVHIGARALLDI
jgi:hypothetical protein